VKLWIESGETPLVASMEKVKLPAAVAVPLRSPDELKVTPAGSEPVSENVGVGLPVAVTWNDPAVFKKKVVLAALVIAGAA